VGDVTVKFTQNDGVCNITSFDDVCVLPCYNVDQLEIAHGVANADIGRTREESFDGVEECNNKLGGRRPS
jgi:hypothetical protein